MSNAGNASSNFPTMIIPKGTEIRVNEEGQLSIRTPGNLVIQNSGNYSEIESTSGSIRIEQNVKVDAISVKASEACFIEGTLTAWRVAARKITLEDHARAYIMLQESEELELSPSSRLVGNFQNEKEIYLLMGRFNRQMRELPGSVGMEALEDLPPNPQKTSGFGQAEGGAVAGSDTPREIAQAVTLMELEINRSGIDNASKEALRELTFSLRERDFTRAALVYREAFSELTTPSENLKRAYELLERYFDN